MAAQGYVRHRGSWRIAQEVPWRRKPTRSTGARRTGGEGPGLADGDREGPRQGAGRIAVHPRDHGPLRRSRAGGNRGRRRRGPGSAAAVHRRLGKLQSLAGTAAFIRCAAEDHDANVCDAALHQLTRFGTVAAQRASRNCCTPRTTRKSGGPGTAWASSPPRLDPAADQRPGHRAQVPGPDGRQPGELNLGFGGGPSGGGNSFGVGGRPQVVKRQLQNESVLNALVAICRRQLRLRRRRLESLVHPAEHPPHAEPAAAGVTCITLTLCDTAIPSPIDNPPIYAPR